MGKKKEFYTVKEFAGYLGVHYNTVYKAIKTGHIQAFKVGPGKKASYMICHSEISRLHLFNLEDIFKNLKTVKDE
jgi:excisionase family DNA binding protein